MGLNRLLPLLSLSLGFADTRLQPADFQYLGAFALPSGFEYNAGAMTYYPAGDPGGSEDGFPGSIFSIGHSHQDLFAEVDIPKPVKSKNYGALPKAKRLQDFADLYSVFRYQNWSGQRVRGIEYLPAQGQQTSGKLHLSYGDAYTIHDGQLSFGWADMDLKNPNVKGPWELRNQNKHCQADFIFEIPETWAATHTPGLRLVTGRYRNGSWCGNGPALLAYGPWNEGNPPAAGSSLKANVLLQYDTEHAVKDFNTADKWTGGAWVESNGRAAVVLSGRKGMGEDNYGIVCGEKGFYAADGYRPGFLFYDPQDFEQVLQSKKKTWDPQPYAFLDVNSLLLYPNKDVCGKSQVAALAYDRARNIVYGMEPHGSETIVHVWKLESDPTPPSKVGGLKATTTTQGVELTWGAAADPESGISAYQIFRSKASGAADFLALATSGEKYIDKSLEEDTRYYYRVKALNGSSLPSTDFSNEVMLVTRPDTDPPLLSSAQVASPTSILLLFTEDLDKASAESATNYSLSGGVSVKVAVLQANRRSVLLSTEELQLGTSYDLSIGNIKDASKAKNTMAAVKAQLTLTNIKPVVSAVVSGSGAKYEWDILEPGKPVYVDRSYTFSELPAQFKGLDYLKTANEDKISTGSDFLHFSTNRNLKVYVGYAYESPTTWMAGWGYTQESVKTTDRPLHVFSKVVPAGEVVLGGNELAPSMYSVWTSATNEEPNSVMTFANGGKDWGIRMASGHIVFDYAGYNPLTAQNPVLEIYSAADGRLLDRAHYSNAHQFSATGLSSGTYLVRYRDVGNGAVYRFHWIQP